MLKKILRTGLFAMVAVLLLMPTVLAETAPLTLMEDMDGVYLNEILTTGDTAYLFCWITDAGNRVGNCALYRWKEGDAEATLVTDKLVSSSVYDTDLESVYADMDVDVDHAVTYLFTDGERLMGYNVVNGLFYEIVPDEGGVTFHDLATLQDKTPFMHIVEDESYYIQPYSTLATGDTLLCLVADYTPDYKEIMKLVRVDLKTGEAVLSKVENVVSVCRYKDGKALLTMRSKEHAEVYYDEKKQRYYPLELAEYDLQADAAVKVGEFDGNTYRPEWTWSDLLQAPVWVANARVQAYLNLSEVKQVGYVPSSYAPYIGVVGNKILVYGNNGVSVREISKDFRADVYLNTFNVYSTGMASFSKQYPNVPVYTNDEWYSDMESIAQAMVTGSDSLDILRMTISYSSFETMLRKGYCADLSASQSLTDTVSRMYPVFQEAVKNKNGKICAVPVSAYSSGWRVNRNVMEDVGLTMDDIPTNYVELCEFVTRWNEEYAEEYDMYTVFSTSGSDYVKNNLFNMVLTEYINYCKAQNGSIRFDTPVFREVVAAIENMEVGDILPSWENDDGGVWRESLFDSGYTVVGSFSVDDSYSIEMPLSLTADTPVINTANVSVVFINPKSRNMDMALKYVECMVEEMNQEDSVRAVLFADQTEPVLNESYEENIKFMEQDIEWIEQQLAAADPSEKKDWETNLEYSRQWLEEYKTYYRYSISPEALAHYQQDIVPTIAVGTRTFLNSSSENANGELTTLIKRYLDKQIKLDQFIKEADQKLMMMEMEDQ